MKILVIGGAGYIGSHMYHFLRDRKCEVLVLDNLTTGHAAFVDQEHLIIGDFADQTLLRKILTEHSIDTVMHFAALSIVHDSIRDPLTYYQNNLAKTLLLLTLLAEYRVKNFIFSSTAAVYGHPQYLPIDIDHATKPINPYGMSKLAIEQLLNYFSQNYNINYMILRYFNAAGADPKLRCGEWHESETHLIPRILQAIINKTPVHIYGDQHETRDGTCLRDYIHVNDLANGHYLALNHLRQGKASGVYNLGTGRGYTVKEVIAAVEQVTGQPLQVEIKPARPGDPAALIAKPNPCFANHCQYSDMTTIIRDAWRWENFKESVFNPDISS